MALLPVVVDLGKGIKTAEQGHGRVFHEGDFPSFLISFLNRTLGPRLGPVPAQGQQSAADRKHRNNLWKQGGSSARQTIRSWVRGWLNPSSTAWSI